MKVLLRIAGLAAVAFGALFFLQGLDVVHWPASSFMLAKPIWCLWGGLIAAAGALIIWRSRRQSIARKSGHRSSAQNDAIINN
jgi:hypothetical protein